MHTCLSYRDIKLHLLKSVEYLTSTLFITLVKLQTITGLHSIYTTTCKLL